MNDYHKWFCYVVKVTWEVTTLDFMVGLWLLSMGCFSVLGYSLLPDIQVTEGDEIYVIGEPLESLYFR